MAKLFNALGLMSGTSMDGIDVALIETDGVDVARPLATHFVTYPEPFREVLREAFRRSVRLRDRQARPGTLTATEYGLTMRHADAVREFRRRHLEKPIELIGFHGQTVLHRPIAEPGLPRVTVQLGDGPALARETGIGVVYNLRAADFAAGGQGAPLVPAYHRAIVATVPERPVAVLNIGRGGKCHVHWRRR